MWRGDVGEEPRLRSNIWIKHIASQRFAEYNLEASYREHMERPIVQLEMQVRTLSLPSRSSG